MSKPYLDHTLKYHHWPPQPVSAIFLQNIRGISRNFDFTETNQEKCLKLSKRQF